MVPDGRAGALQSRRRRAGGRRTAPGASPLLEERQEVASNPCMESWSPQLGLRLFAPRDGCGLERTRPRWLVAVLGGKYRDVDGVQSASQVKSRIRASPDARHERK